MFAKCCWYFLQVVALFLCAGELFGQATGTIYGTVRDASNAAVPGAHITVTNTATNVPRGTTTDNQGEFKVLQLPAGNYRVKVDKEGFNSFLQENITLHADSTVQVQATLQLKSVTQSVTVSATALMVQANQTNLVQVVDEKRIEDLPLNGRNVLQLMAINNGTSFDNTTEGGAIIETQTFGNGSYAIPVSVNGSRANQTNYQLDDQDNNDYFQNINEPFPNPDAIEEFTMQTSTFDAEYGRGVGCVVNMVTKSGTNEFHGTAFDFLRNYAMNSRNFFTGRDTLKRNQFGGSLGGPIVKNKTFIFGSYQGTRQSSATPSALFCCAPDAAMKQGDLSEFLGSNGLGTILDPITGQPFAGNLIPTIRFDSVSAKLLNDLPTANLPNHFYRFATPPNIFRDDQMVLRGDEILSDRQRVFARYFFLDMNIPWGFIPNNLYYVDLGQHGTIESVTLNHTYTFSPRFMNEVGLSYHRETPQATTPQGQLSYTALGANVLTPSAPSLILGINGVSGFLWNGLGYFTSQQTYELNDNVSLVTGKQSIRFGGEAKRYRMDVVSYYLSGGFAQFSGNLTSIPGKANPMGNAWGEFLLGDLSNWQQQSYWSERLYNWYYNLYAQDDVRLTPKLTLNAGLRWEPRPAYSEIDDKETTFIPGAQSRRYPNAPLGIVFPGDPGVGGNVIPNRWTNLAPRVGFAFQLRPKTVIRAAYGIFYDEEIMGDNNIVASNPPFVDKASCGPPCPGPLSNPLGSATPFDPVPIPASPAFKFPAYNSWQVPDHFQHSPYSQSWNFTAEHQLGANLLVRGTYLGTEAVHLFDGMNINIPVYIPGQSTGANENQRRPYQPIGPLIDDETIGTSNYQALQVTAQQRSSHGLSLLANYTYGKVIDTASGEQSSLVLCPENLKACRGPSDFDITHRFVLSGVIEHPQLRNWKNSFARTVLGGWQSNLIFTAQTGSPFSVMCPDDNSLTGLGTDFCDRVPDVSPYLANPAVHQWFNPAAFKPNGIGTFGNEGRNTLWSPGYWNLDYSLFKNFPVKEGFTLQLRGEAFNIFNHPNFGTPSNNYFSDPGVITYATPPRIIQIAAKIIF